MSEIQLPEGWVWKKLRDISDRIHYGYTASSTRENTGVKLLRITDIQDYKVDWTTVPFCTISKGDLPKYRIQQGDLLFARTGATVGKSFLVTGDLPGSVFASYLIRVILAQEIDRKFIFLFFQSPHYWQQIKAGSVGIGQPNVNGNILSGLDIPLPPLPVQQAIVARIEELFSELEDGVRELQTALARLKIYRQAVLHHYLTNPDWERVKLSTVTLIITDGDHQAPPKADDGVPFIVISNIKKNQVNFSQTKFVPEDYYNSIKDSRKPKFGDILYTVTGSYGIPVLLETDRKFCFQRHIGLVRPDVTRIVRKYLFYVLASRNIYNQATTVATGTAQLTVPLSGIRNFKIPLPDLNTQTQIVAEIEARLSEADSMETTIRQELTRAESLRQSILKQAFEGKLVAVTTDQPKPEEPVLVSEPTSPVYGDPAVGTSGEQLRLF
jgi:type I restriction enzyme S subunit